MTKYIIRHVSSKGPWDKKVGLSISYSKRRPSEVVPEGILELDDDKQEQLMYGEIHPLSGALNCYPLTGSKGWNAHDFREELQVQPCGDPAYLYDDGEAYPLYSQYQIVIPDDFKFYVLIQSPFAASRILHVPLSKPVRPKIYSRGDMLHEAIIGGYAPDSWLEEAGLLSSTLAASIIGVDRSLVLRWCREGRFTSALQYGKRGVWVLDKEEVRRFTEKERKVGAPENNQNAKK